MKDMLNKKAEALEFGNKGHGYIHAEMEDGRTVEVLANGENKAILFMLAAIVGNISKSIGCTTTELYGLLNAVGMAKEGDRENERKQVS